MATSERMFLPAAGHDWFLPLYDPFTKLFGLNRLHRLLIDQASLQPQHRVLDLGCGTGTLAVSLKKLYPTIDVVGLDPDPRALERANRKAGRNATPVWFDHGFADALPYPEQRFDRVFSSMMYHHLERTDRPKALREIHRVLKPGGRLELLDFSGPDSGTHGVLARLLHSHHRLQDNSADHIVSLMRQAGFVDARQIREERTLLGAAAFYQALPRPE